MYIKKDQEEQGTGEYSRWYIHCTQIIREMEVGHTGYVIRPRQRCMCPSSVGVSQPSNEYSSFRLRKGSFVLNAPVQPTRQGERGRLAGKPLLVRTVLACNSNRTDAAAAVCITSDLQPLSFPTPLFPSPTLSQPLHSIALSLLLHNSAVSRDSI